MARTQSFQDIQFHQLKFGTAGTQYNFYLFSYSNDTSYKGLRSIWFMGVVADFSRRSEFAHRYFRSLTIPMSTIPVQVQLYPTYNSNTVFKYLLNLIIPSTCTTRHTSPITYTIGIFLYVNDMWQHKRKEVCTHIFFFPFFVYIFATY